MKRSPVLLPKPNSSRRKTGIAFHVQWLRRRQRLSLRRVLGDTCPHLVGDRKGPPDDQHAVVIIREQRQVDGPAALECELQLGPQHYPTNEHGKPGAGAGIQEISFTREV